VSTFASEKVSALGLFIDSALELRTVGLHPPVQARTL